MTATLQTPRLILRRPTPADWPAFRDFYISERAASLGGPATLGKSWRHFASELGHWEIHGYGMWTVTLRGDDTAVGLIGPWTPVDWPETEIGWIILSGDLEGKGVAAEAAAAAVKHAYEVLGWHTAVSYIASENTRSIRLAEKLGAVRDDNAPKPEAYPDTLVYRHPVPEVSA
ncbi:GNAT family N-acetyltransferase [Yoonia sp. SDW83-1]|uniref:GNAT family N-acetyltransferase n=1 Tax=Yoonia sp. SDW83-1 TaxID=3366945 RepID=UPI00398C7B54